MYNIFDISGSGMKAQSTRLTTTASNMSNADVVSGSDQAPYSPNYPIVKPESVNSGQNTLIDTPGVEVSAIYQSNQPPIQRYQPSHPLANDEGYVYLPNVNMVEEMTNMMSASKGYRMNVEVLTTAKELMARTLQMGE